VLQVLDALKLRAPVLVGHSFGGQDLSTIGAEHPGRIAGLVYLNSAEDPTIREYGVAPVDSKRLPAAMRKAPDRPDYSSFQAYRDWQMRVHGVAFPEAELRMMFTANPDGSMGAPLTSTAVRAAMFAGIRKPDYQKIRVPVLAFVSLPRSCEDQMQRFPPRNESERAAMKQKCALDLAVPKRHEQDLKNGVPGAKMVELPGANFYVFLSNEAGILREMKLFLAGLTGTF